MEYSKMNINIIEHLAKTVTPKLLGGNADRSESSMLNQLFAIMLGRFTDDSVFSTVLNGYNKLTGNGSLNVDDISMDSLSSLSSLLWKDDAQAGNIVSQLASNHGVGESKVKGLMASALPLVLTQLKGLAGDTPVSQFLRNQPQDDEKSFLNYIPNWALAMLPAGLLGAGATAAKADTKPAYAANKTTTTTTTTVQKTEEKQGGGFLKGLLPLLGLLILAALAWSMLKGCNGADTQPTAAQTEEVVAADTAEQAPSVLNVAVDADGNVAASAEAGDQSIVDTIKGSLAGVFGDDVANAANLAVNDKLAANLPVAEKLNDVLGLVKGVPGAAASIAGQNIKVNTPDAESRDKLVGDLQGLLPDFTVEADDKLDLGSLVAGGAAAVAGAAGDVVDGAKEGALDVAGAVDNSITAAQDALNGLTDKVTGEDFAKALNLQIINFETNGDAIPEKNQAILNKAAEVMAKLPEAQLKIVGHTDDRGDDAHNQALSQQRAEAVKAYLVEKGVAAERMTAEGAGETQPIADNNTAEGQFKNRRIEFQVIEAGKEVASAGNADEKTEEATVETESK